MSLDHFEWQNFYLKHIALNLLEQQNPANPAPLIPRDSITQKIVRDLRILPDLCKYNGHQAKLGSACNNSIQYEQANFAGIVDTATCKSRLWHLFSGKLAERELFLLK